MYRKIILGFFFITAITTCLRSQVKTTEIYLNHVFIVLDSLSYAKLSDSNFVTQKLGNLKTASTATTADSWTGKYFHGKNGYFEFFSIKSYKGAALGDCGLGFMTQKSNDILTIEANWRKQTDDLIIKDTSIRIVQGIKNPWYYSLSLNSTDSLLPLAIWVMEHTPEELKSVGFTAEESKKEIRWEEYMSKKQKKEFTKSFNRIKAIHLLLDYKNYTYLKTSLLGFGLREKENIFFNNQIAIKYTLTESFPIRVQAMETELTESFSENYIKLSDNLKVHVNKNKATWIFTY
jgi:hypothetical protein